MPKNNATSPRPLERQFPKEIKEVATRTADATPSKEDVLEAVKTLIRWAGDDPSREGLIDTPDRVYRAYQEFFAGYRKDPFSILDKTFSLDKDYTEPVILKKIPFSSHCEHHILPIVGHVDIAYLPAKRVVGLSKLGRVVQVFAQRLQTQENMTVQIGKALEEGLAPHGVAVHIHAIHQCMSIRGLKGQDINTITKYYGGVYKESSDAREEIKKSLS